MQTSGRGMRAIMVGFAAWVAYWALSGAGFPRAGLLAGLGLAAVVFVARRRRGGPRLLETSALVVLAALAALAALGVAGVGAWGPPLSQAALAGAALVTVARGTPFTATYVREGWPREYWMAPLFLRTNGLVSAAWVIALAVAAVAGGAAALWPDAGLWLGDVVPQAAMGAAVAVSVALPRWYPRHRAAREIAAREPYAWTPPFLPARQSPGRGGPDVTVVGAGIGGLTAGALLARRGLSVLVLEQHYLAGGFCTSWPRLVRRGAARLRYVFDAGVHDVSGLGPRGPVRHLLATLGLTDRLEWRRVSHEYIQGGERFRVPDRADDMAEALARRFPAEATGVRRFLAEMEAVYREMYADTAETGGVPGPPATADAMLAWPAAHPHAFRWMHVPFPEMLEAHVRDARLRDLLSALTGYLTDDGRALTVGQMAPIFGYYFDGGFYPAGGSQALADALVGTIEAHGGSVRLRTAVERIRVESGRVAGVALADGTVIEAPAVVSNADVRRTFLDLVGPERLPRPLVAGIEALRPSASAVAVFLGLDTVPDLAPLTLLSDGSESVAIATPSLVDPALAPPGHAAVTLLRLVPAAEAATWDRKALGYAARKRAAGDTLMRRAEAVIPGLRDHVVYRQDATPATFARYAWTTGGAIYGPALGGVALPVKTPIQGLVLAGSGVFPGAGVEAVVISGTNAADALCPAAAAAPVAPARVAA